MSKNKGDWGIDKKRAREQKKALKRERKEMRRKEKAKSTVHDEVKGYDAKLVYG